MKSREEIVNIDRKHIWHPFTQMKDYEDIDPVVITRGKGIFIYDEAGNEYYDTISSWWVNILGHCHPRISGAVKKQLDTLEHVNFSGFTHPYATELIEELNHIMPKGMGRYFFSDNGSTAIEVAIKMAFQYWLNRKRPSKQKFVMLNNSYHGDTLGATSVGAVDIFHKIYKPLMFDGFRVKAPYEFPYEREFTYDAMDQYDPAAFE
ncbi:MAG: aminotransferase class III-fold pyridoxal phosphate-dependent enzyme, partial [Lentisphaeria bacterium]|nr:aminotransferase class III-fold pyridoxal phosphate-dependent enzyme [Lentisphaeria bacterium]